MNELLANMEINRIILHKIHKRKSSDIIEEPTYNSNLTTLDDDALLTFNERVIQALGSDSNSIEMDITNKENDSTFSYIKKGIGIDDGEFIEISKKIAFNLAKSQRTLKIPGGIFIMFDGTIGVNDNNFIAVMKAETQEGFTLIDKAGYILTLGHLRELFLTPQQKLYKIGVFIKIDDDESQEEGFRCIIYDKNLSKSRNSEAAKYFYEDFLGCSQNKNSKVLTKKFYIESQNNIIKDTSRVERIMKNRRILFSKDIKLTGPSDKFDDAVKIETNGDETIITIKDKIIGQE